MPTARDEIESANLVDFRLIGNYMRFTVGAFRRRVSLVLLIVGTVFTLTAVGLLVLPKTWHVETRVLAQRNQALALRGENQGEAPTRTAVETVMRRDNLIAIIKQTDLLHEWYKSRAPLPHLKDVVVRALTKPETEQETIEWMTDVLEKRLGAATADGIVFIGVDWPDPKMALRIIDTAQQNYLEARHATEITAIAEQVSILQKHALSLRGDIDTAVDAIEKLRADRAAHPTPAAPAPGNVPATAQPAPARAPAAAERPDPDLTQLKVMIEAKQRAINDLEDFRRRRVSELNAALAEKLATYTESHPVIVDLRQTIASLSTESPQVQALRAEVEHLKADFEEKSSRAGAEARAIPILNTGAAPGALPPLPGSIIRIEQEPNDERDPAMMYARQQLKDAMDKYSQLRAQVEATQIDFDTAEAAFKYRYSVIEPPKLPKKPAKPNAPLVLVAALIGGLLVSVLAAVMTEVRTGTFVERWQVERALDLPVLTEMDLAALAKHTIE